MARQHGFALMEFLVIAALAILLAVWGSQSLVNRLNDAKANAAATWMLSVRQGVQTYLHTHADALRQASTPTAMAAQGYQDWAGPALAELKHEGLLPASLPEAQALVGGVHIRVMRSDDCPSQDCRLDAIVYGQKPLTKRRGAMVDEPMMAHWLMGSDGQGGVVHPDRPGAIQGQMFHYPNPLPGVGMLPAGTVAMAISGQHDRGNDDFLRVRDERDPDFQGALHVQGDIHTERNLVAGGGLRLHATARLLDACEHTGDVARDAVLGLLVCTNGAWLPGARSPGAYSVNSRYGCATDSGKSTANPATGACSCPMGAREVRVSEGAINGTDGITRGYVCVY